MRVQVHMSNCDWLPWFAFCAEEKDRCTPWENSWGLFSLSVPHVQYFSLQLFYKLQFNRSSLATAKCTITNFSLILPVLWQIRLKPHKIILSSTKHPQSRTTYPSSSSVRKQQMTLPTTSRSRSYLARTKLSSPFSFLSHAYRWLLPSSSSSLEFAVVAGRTRRTAVRQRRGRVRDAS